MNTTKRFKSKQEQFLSILDNVSQTGKGLGVILQTADDQQLDGRSLTINGHKVLNFSSCSYLGLDQHPTLIEGAIDATRRYGVQFSSSRTYVASPLYGELEEKLSQIFKSPALVTNTTTLGHIGNVQLLIGDEDAVILDVSVHASVHQAVQLLESRHIPIEVVRHNRLDMLEDQIKKLSVMHRKIWYFTDGVFSMFGDLAPMDDLRVLLDRYEQLHLYVDDAHGMSWMGEHGAGFAMSRLPYHERMYLTTSMGKAFGASGGIMVYPNKDDFRRVHDYGKTLIFSIQLPPPILGAAVASANIHLSAEIYEKQRELATRVLHFKKTARMLELPVMADPVSPIKFIALGKPPLCYSMMQRLLKAGFFTNMSAYPSVSYNQSGIRIPLTTHHTIDDIDQLLHTIAVALPAAFTETNSSMAEIVKFFKLDRHPNRAAAVLV